METNKTNNKQKKEQYMTMVRMPESMAKRIEFVIYHTKPKFNSVNHLMNIAIDGFLKIQEEKIQTRIKEVVKNGKFPKDYTTKNMGSCEETNNNNQY